MSEQERNSPWSRWPSSTNQPLQPQLDAEAMRRAAAVVAATIGSGNSLPLSTPGTYMGARLAAGTPQPRPQNQQPDLRGVVDRMPANMPGVIDALLGGGATNRGIVLGDTDHSFKGIPEMLADPQAIAAMRRNGVTHLFIECEPYEFAQLLRLENNNPTALLVRRAQNAGITVVPMDLRGPMTTAHFNALSEMVRVGARGDREATSRALQRFNETANGFSEERMRVTNQVWVPRIVETMQAARRTNPNARFIVLGGNAHINNHVLMNTPDINCEDLDERLARALNAPVPYVRMEADHNSFAPRVERGVATADSLDTPDLLIHVPSLEVQRIQHSPLRNSPESVQRQALAAYRDYRSAMINVAIGEIGLLPAGVNGQNLRDSDLHVTSELGTAYEQALNGQIRDARRTTLAAALRFAADYPLEGASPERATIIRHALGEISEMQGALGRLETLHAGRALPEVQPAVPPLIGSPPTPSPTPPTGVVPGSGIPPTPPTPGPTRGVVPGSGLPPSTPSANPPMRISAQPPSQPQRVGQEPHHGLPIAMGRPITDPRSV